MVDANYSHFKQYHLTSCILYLIDFAQHASLCHFTNENAHDPRWGYWFALYHLVSIDLNQSSRPAVFRISDTVQDLLSWIVELYYPIYYLKYNILFNMVCLIFVKTACVKGNLPKVALKVNANISSAANIIK